MADSDAGMAADPASELFRPLVGLIPRGDHLRDGQLAVRPDGVVTLDAPARQWRADLLIRGRGLEGREERERTWFEASERGSRGFTSGNHVVGRAGDPPCGSCCRPTAERGDDGDVKILQTARGAIGGLDGRVGRWESSTISAGEVHNDGSK